MPNRKRPPLKRSSVEISLARSSGFRSGTSTMPVPSFMRLVTPEARASATNGSMKCEYVSGMTPSAEPGKRLVVCTGMKGCSAHQNDSKPSSSAFWAMKATSTLYAGSGTDTPMFMRALLSGAVYHWAPRGLHGDAIRRVRPHRAGAGTAAGPDLSRALDPDRASRRRRLLRLPPGPAPHAGHPQPGAVAERVSGRGRTADPAVALRSVRLRAPVAPPAPPDRRDQHARQPERWPAGARRGPRRRDGSLLLGPGGRLRDELRALSRDTGHHARRAEPRPPHLQRPLPQLRAAADVPAAAAEALP